MGVRTITEGPGGQTVLYDSVTMTAFGPVFSTEDHANHFLAWADHEKGITDVRAVNEISYAGGIAQLYADWAATCLDPDDNELTDEAEHAEWSPFA